MIEADDAFDQLIKVSWGRKHSQCSLNRGFEFQSEVSHTRVEGISEDLTKGGEFSSEGRCRAGLFQTRELVFKLSSTLFVLVEGNESFEEGVIINEQGRA